MLKTTVDMAFSREEELEFLRANDFGQLIVLTDSPAPLVTPLHFTLLGEHAIETHLHRNNPMLEAVKVNPAVTLAVIGAYVYIPTAWNGDEGADPQWSAPTSYYGAVQVQGEAEIVSEPNDLAALINRQMTHFQPEGGYHEVVADSSPFGRMLLAIRGIRFEIRSITSKFKFGGNRTPAHRERIADHLLKRDGPLDRQAHQLVLQRSALHAERTP